MHVDEGQDGNTAQYSIVFQYQYQWWTCKTGNNNIDVTENACATTHIHDHCILRQSWIRDDGISVSINSNLHEIGNMPVQFITFFTNTTGVPFEIWRTGDNKRESKTWEAVFQDPFQIYPLQASTKGELQI